MGKALLFAALFGMLPAGIVDGQPKAAPAPAGFAEIPWRAAPQDVEAGLKGKCSQRTWGPSTLWCRGYTLPGVGEGSVKFEFEPEDSLAGYTIYLTGSAHGFRAVVIEKFGRPRKTVRSGIGGVVEIDGVQKQVVVGTEASAWDWPNVSALLIDGCPASVDDSMRPKIGLCLTVSTKPLLAKRARDADEKRGKARKGF